MLNLPVPPRTRISRQLSCVSCHEMFTIAEDDSLADGSSWQMPADNYPDVHLRYQSDRSRRPVVPENPANPNRQIHLLNNEHHRSLNCPRCGADNRNWLHILNPPLDVDADELNEQSENWFFRPPRLRQIGVVVSAVAFGLFIFNYWKRPQNFWFEVFNTLIVCLLLLLPLLFSPVQTIVKARYWRRKYGMAAAGIVITIIFMFMAGYFYFHWDSERVFRSITLLIAIGLAGIIMTIQVLSTWLAQREYGYFRKVVTPTSFSQRISPALKVWLGFTALYLIIIPLLFYVILPSAFYWLSTLVEPAPPVTAVPTLEQRINNILGELEIVLVEAPPGTIEPAAEAIDDLVAFLEGVPMPVDALDNLTLDQKAAVTLAWTNDLLKNASEEDKQSIRNAISNLETFIATANLNVATPETTNTETAATENEANQPPWTKLDKSFLQAWFKYVLAASIASLVFSLSAVNKYVRRLNLQLPPPIFYSLANMTRVVIWEAKRALEIGDEFKFIQWTNVHRNQLGGIVLEGFYRDDSLRDLPDSSPTTKVRAQRYQIISDRWGHILSSDIKTAHVYRLPRRSLPANMNIGDEFFVNVPARLVEQERP